MPQKLLGVIQQRGEVGVMEAFAANPNASLIGGPRLYLRTSAKPLLRHDQLPQELRKSSHWQ